MVFQLTIMEDVGLKKPGPEQNNQTSEKVLRFKEKKQVARPWWEAEWSGALSRISQCLRRNSAVLQNSVAAADRTTSNRLTSFLQHVMWHARKVSRQFHGQTRGELSYIWWLKVRMRVTHFSGSLRSPRSHNYKYVGPTVFTLSPELPPNDACQLLNLSSAGSSEVGWMFIFFIKDLVEVH